MNPLSATTNQIFDYSHPLILCFFYIDPNWTFLFIYIYPESEYQLIYILVSDFF